MEEKSTATPPAKLAVWLEKDAEAEWRKVAYVMIRELFPEIPEVLAQGFASEHIMLTYPSDPYSSAVLLVHGLRPQLLDCAERSERLTGLRKDAQNRDALMRAIGASGQLQGTPAGTYPTDETGS